MDPAEVARGDQVVNMHVPQRGGSLRLVFAEQPLELTQARHLGAPKTEPAGYLGLQLLPTLKRAVFQLPNPALAGTAQLG
jgi:hypothetical protein